VQTTLTSYLNVADDAPWTATTVETDHFIHNQQVLTGKLPAMCYLDGWFAESLLWDVMHNLFQGCAPDFCGSSLAILVEMQYFGFRLSKRAALRRATKLFRRYCTKHQVQCQTPVWDETLLSKLASTAFPIMTVKAHIIKVVCMWLAVELRTASFFGGEEVVRAALCSYHLASWLHITSIAGWILTEAQASQAHYHGRMYIKTYKVLAMRAAAVRIMRWPVRPKLHCLDHTFRDSLKNHRNPMFWTCFNDEDFMGRIKKLAAKCHGGRRAERVLQRYNVMLAWRWHERKQRLGSKSKRHSSRLQPLGVKHL
jgi:hypothetical protein